MYHFDPNDVLLVIVTNITMRLMTGFVLQGHIYIYKWNLSCYIYSLKQITKAIIENYAEKKQSLGSVRIFVIFK